MCAILLTSLISAEEQLNKNYIERVFKDVIEDLHADEAVISQYFSHSYIQHVDGHTLNYKEFIQHMLAQKAILSSAKVTIEQCLTEGNKICTVHIVDAAKKNGEKVKVKVIAYYEIEDDKITLCDELTHVLNGKAEDQKIGSMK
jgi:limonene-1,2-epoxide hydrolase